MLLNHFCQIIMYISTGKTQASVFSTSSQRQVVTPFNVSRVASKLLFDFAPPATPPAETSKVRKFHRKSWGDLRQCYKKLNPSA